MTKLSKEDRQEIRDMRMNGRKYKEISEKFQVNVATIFYSLNRWKEKERLPYIDRRKNHGSHKSTSGQVASSIHVARMKVLDLLGGVCVRCGFSDPRALQVDHIHGGGSKELRKKGNYSVYLKIIRDIDLERSNYQILCANCNWIKRYENKEHRNNVRHFNY